MANKALVLGSATIGGVMIYSGLAGVSVMDVLAGKASLKDLDPKGGKGIDAMSATAANRQSANAQDLLNTSLSGRSPKAIIDSEVIPLAAGRGMQTGNTVAAVEAANARHGPTVTGGRSDHQGPPNERWAADMSNGDSPTAQMDQLAQEIAHKFGIRWRGAGAVSKNVTIDGQRYRAQLIYRSLVGGNHFNHVHFGLEAL